MRLVMSHQPNASGDGAADGVPHVVLLGREGGQHDERHDQGQHRSARCTVFDGGPAVHQAGQEDDVHDVKAGPCVPRMVAVTDGLQQPRVAGGDRARNFGRDEHEKHAVQHGPGDHHRHDAVQFVHACLIPVGHACGNDVEQEEPEVDHRRPRQKRHVGVDGQRNRVVLRGVGRVPQVGEHVGAEGDDAQLEEVHQQTSTMAVLAHARSSRRRPSSMMRHRSAMALASSPSWVTCTAGRSRAFSTERTVSTKR